MDALEVRRLAHGDSWRPTNSRLCQGAFMLQLKAWPPMINSLPASRAREILRVSEVKAGPGPIIISGPGVFFAERDSLTGLARMERSSLPRRGHRAIKLWAPAPADSARQHQDGFAEDHRASILCKRLCCASGFSSAHHDSAGRELHCATASDTLLLDQRLG